MITSDERYTGSELWPRKVELACAHSKNVTTVSLYMQQQGVWLPLIKQPYHVSVVFPYISWDKYHQTPVLYSSLKVCSH